MFKKIIKGTIVVLLGIMIVNTLSGNITTRSEEKKQIHFAGIEPGDCEPESYSIVKNRVS
ncbi:hypothetical protein [Oceanirhabdus sp. W0125-5]|uniref:hypothetical protein n=1 Tax=Oceanirhabdus sp. W0125-5 TaxID=2999116 RepID=UPI0022F2C301|nr:hypothetical protein [Oceanirhabdus sp. W0125-5]WBW96382.1 hypothetical protein OW730_22205 [Oceanirhabdus sp. W0125-5]